MRLTPSSVRLIVLLMILAALMMRCTADDDDASGATTFEEWLPTTTMSSPPTTTTSVVPPVVVVSLIDAFALDYAPLVPPTTVKPVVAWSGHLPPGTATAEQLAMIRECESRGDYEILNPSGKYRGGYQFGQPTWDGVAARHYPHLVGVDPATVTPGEQDAMARALFSERGSQPWPTCGRGLA